MTMVTITGIGVVMNILSYERTRTMTENTRKDMTQVNKSLVGSSKLFLLPQEDIVLNSMGKGGGWKI